MNMKQEHKTKVGGLLAELPILSEVPAAGPAAPAQWRSLSERAVAASGEVDSLDQLLELEAVGADPAHRRDFLRLMGASMALAGVATQAGCAIQHPEDVVPYVDQPMNMEWCLTCHQKPEAYLREKRDVFNMEYSPSEEEQLSLGKDLVRRNNVPVDRMSNCSVCHR